MARTRQTARKSTGSRAPRRHLRSYDDSDVIEVLPDGADLRRTIAVNGVAAFEVAPDLIVLPFEIVERSFDPLGATEQAVSKLGETRQKLISLGIQNESISSDSLSFREIVEEEDDEDEDEDEHSAKKRKKSDLNDEKDNNEEIEEEEKPSVIYEAKIVLHVSLEGEQSKLFGKVMITLLSLGLQQSGNPTYDLLEINAHRNDARRDAIKNAVEKAAVIVESLENPRLSLGAPLVIRDLVVDLEETVSPSFSFFNMFSQSSRTITSGCHREEDVSRRMEALLSQADQLFVPPDIRVVARIQTLFQLVDGSEEGNEVEEEVTMHTTF
jgi:uncharacterized protein YggE